MWSDHAPVISRRKLLQLGLASTCSVTLEQSFAAIPESIITHITPSSGEPIPATGMGTWINFKVGNDASLRSARCEVLETF